MSSVDKGKRNKSKIEFDNLCLKIMDDLYETTEIKFGASQKQYEEHKIFIDDKCREILRIGDLILRYVKIANVYPSGLIEYYTRRDYQNRAIGLCFSLLTNFQTVMHKLEIPDDKHANTLDDINHMINSLRNWRTSDNHFKRDYINQLPLVKIGEPLYVSESNAANANNNGNANYNGAQNANYVVGISAFKTGEKSSEKKRQ